MVVLGFIGIQKGKSDNMIFTEPRQKKLLEKVKEYYKVNKPDIAHEFDHTVRVVYWVIILSKKENADTSITIPAAMLHDIAIPIVGDEKHAREGAKLCKPLLEDCGYSKKEIEKIAETISMHSTDDPNPNKTLEGKILFDADKLDVIGPIGLHRWFLEYARKGYMHHKAVKKALSTIAEFKKIYGGNIFFTETAREIYKEKSGYAEKICGEILKDLEKFKDIYKEASLSD